MPCPDRANKGVIKNVACRDCTGRWLPRYDSMQFAQEQNRVPIQRSAADGSTSTPLSQHQLRKGFVGCLKAVEPTLGDGDRGGAVGDGDE